MIEKTKVLGILLPTYYKPDSYLQILESLKSITKLNELKGVHVILYVNYQNYEFTQTAEIYKLIRGMSNIETVFHMTMNPKGINRTIRYPCYELAKDTCDYFLHMDDDLIIESIDAYQNAIDFLLTDDRYGVVKISNTKSLHDIQCGAPDAIFTSCGLLTRNTGEIFTETQLDYPMAFDDLAIAFNTIKKGYYYAKVNNAKVINHIESIYPEDMINYSPTDNSDKWRGDYTNYKILQDYCIEFNELFSEISYDKHLIIRLCTKCVAKYART